MIRGTVGAVVVDVVDAEVGDGNGEVVLDGDAFGKLLKYVVVGARDERIIKDLVDASLRRAWAAREVEAGDERDEVNVLQALTGLRGGAAEVTGGGAGLPLEMRRAFQIDPGQIKLHGASPRPDEPSARAIRSDRMVLRAEGEAVHVGGGWEGSTRSIPYPSRNPIATT